jgi:hypothetical protein
LATLGPKAFTNEASRFIGDRGSVNKESFSVKRKEGRKVGRKEGRKEGRKGSMQHAAQKVFISDHALETLSNLAMAETKLKVNAPFR